MEKILCWLFLLGSDVLHCVATLAPGIQDRLQNIPAQVVSRSSACSATCGLGMRAQEVCWLDDNGNYRDCQERQVPCVLSWHCSLAMQTAEDGGYVELDCLGLLGFSEAQYRYIFSWRFARGLITMDDLLFERWRPPRIDRVTLDPVQESHAGTYQCNLQDPNYRMVKRVYFGLKVLPKNWVKLGYGDAVTHQTTASGAASNTTSQQPFFSSTTMKEVAIYSLSVSSVLALLILLVLYCLCRLRRCVRAPAASRQAFSSGLNLGTSTSDYNREMSASP